MRIVLNGELCQADDGATVDRIVELAGADPASRGLAVAVAGEVVPRSQWPDTVVHDEDEVEVVSAIQGGTGTWQLGDRQWNSRLIAGSGGFRSLGAMSEALEAAGTEIITVALRRLDPAARSSSTASGSRVRSSPITSSFTQSVPKASRASWAVLTASRAV